MDESQREVAVFFTLVIFAVLALLAFWLLDLLKPLTVLFVIFIVLVVVYSRAGSFFYQLKEYQRAVVFHMGKFKKVYGPGWLFIIPFLESYKVVDLRTKTTDIKPQEVITRDNIKLKLDAIIYMRVTDPEKAIIKVEDYEKAAVSYIQANLRSVVGKMMLSDVISQVMEVNKILQKGLQEVSHDWGVLVDKVEVQSIELPKDVMDAMHYKKAAEQRKFAAMEEAEAKKITIDAVQAAAGKLTDPTLQYMYLQSLQKIAEGKSTKIVFPMELSRLAENLASKMGIKYEKAQERLVDEYQELSKQGKRPSTIIETLKKEVKAKK